MFLGGIKIDHWHEMGETLMIKLCHVLRDLVLFVQF